MAAGALTFLIGGARSGKSTLAVQLGEHHGGAVHFIATAEPFDDDLRERVERHRAERPPSWTTAEVPVELPAAIADAPPEAFVIVDCLTVWLANLLVHVIDPQRRARYEHDMVAALRERAATKSPVVVVSNEVGQGIVPDNAMARAFRDHAGLLHQKVAAVADEVYFVTAGLPQKLKG